MSWWERRPPTALAAERGSYFFLPFFAFFLAATVHTSLPDALPRL